MLHLYNSLRQKVYLQIFTIYVRYLIGGAFIIAAFGMGKVTGKANLLHSMDSPIEKLQPIQQFFRVMVDSGLYWQFIGWTQIIAGVLLMTQRFARVGALIFFGLIVNIFVITVSYSFTGTPIVTGLMTLAATYLLVWDLPAFAPLVMNSISYQHNKQEISASAFWVILGCIMIGSIIVLTLLHQPVTLQLGVPFVEGAIGFILFLLSNRKNN